MTEAAPIDRRYTSEHAWLRQIDETVEIGVTQFAVDALGEIMFVKLPSPGDHVKLGEVFGEAESSKSVSDLFSPCTGTVVEVNDSLSSLPELINDHPYGAGWLIRVGLVQETAPDLLDAQTYEASTRL